MPPWTLHCDMALLEPSAVAIGRVGWRHCETTLEVFFGALRCRVVLEALKGSQDLPTERFLTNRCARVHVRRCA